MPLAVVPRSADNAGMGTWVGYIARRTQAFLVSPGQEVTRWQKVARYVIDLSKHCTRQLIEDRANQMAAALTYHTLFSLIPTMVLMLVVGRLFVSAEDLANYKEGTIDYVLQWLNESSAALATGVETRSQGSQSEFAQTAEVVGQQIEHWFTQLQTINFGAIGVVGVVLFIYGATGLLTTIERSFNRIYDASSNRPLYMRLPMYYTVITLGPLLIALGQYLQNLVFGWLYGSVTTVTTTLGGDIETRTGIGWVGATLINVVVMVSPLISTWVVFCAIYKFLPNTKVRLRPALVGSGVAALGVVLAIELFGLYVRGAAATTLYGPLALMPLFLLWLYLLWLIVLFGLELTHTLQALPSERLKKRTRVGDEVVVLDPQWILPTMAAVAQDFAQGKTTSTDQIGQRLAITPRAAGRITEHLCRAGLLNQVGDSGEPSRRFTLARPAESIPLNDIFEAGHSLTPHASHNVMPASHILGEVATQRQRAFEGRTLADAVTDGHPVSLDVKK